MENGKSGLGEQIRQTARTLKKSLAESVSRQKPQEPREPRVDTSTGASYDMLSFRARTGRRQAEGNPAEKDTEKNVGPGGEADGQMELR